MSDEVKTGLADAFLRGTVAANFGKEEVGEGEKKTPLTALIVRVPDDKSGTTEIRVSAWNGMADEAAKFARGARVQVHGELRVSSFKKGEVEHSRAEVHLNDDGECSIETANGDDDLNQAHLAGKILFVSDKRPIRWKKDDEERETTGLDIGVGIIKFIGEGDEKREINPSITVKTIGRDDEGLERGKRVEVKGVILNRKDEKSGREFGDVFVGSKEDAYELNLTA